MENNKFLAFLASKTGRLVITAVSAVIIYGIILIAFGSENTAFLGITVVVCAIFGWQALNRITPDVFLIMSFAAWGVYFLVKGMLSIFIGVFVAPFQIGKMISNAVYNSLNG